MFLLVLLLPLLLFRQLSMQRHRHQLQSDVSQLALISIRQSLLAMPRLHPQ
jgi:hypothetical protein